MFFNFVWLFIFITVFLGNRFVVYIPYRLETNSVADPDSRSQILFFTHPESRIQKEKQKRVVKKNLLSFFFLLPQISQNLKLFYFWNAEEKKNFLPKQLLNNMGLDLRSRIRDPGSVKNLFWIPDPGV